MDYSLTHDSKLIDNLPTKYKNFLALEMYKEKV